MIYIPTLKLFYDEHGLTMQDLFILQGVFFSLSVAIFEIPSGYFSDVWGRKRSLVIGCVLTLIGYIIFSFSYGFHGFMLALVALGIGSSFISGTDSAMLYDSLAESGRGKDFLKYEGRTVSIGNLSEGVASIVGGLIALLSYRHTFYVQAGIAALAVPVAMSLVEPTRSKLSGSNTIKNIKFILSHTFVKHPLLKWTVFYSSIIGAATWTMAWYTQAIFVELDLAEHVIGILWATLNLSVGLVAWFAHAIDKKLGRNIILLGILIAVSAGYFLVSWNITVWGIVMIFLFYLVRGVATPTLRDYINQITSSEIRATVLSLRSLIIRVMLACITPIFGWLTDAYSLKQAIMCSGITFFALGGISLLFMKRSENKTSKEVEAH